MERKKNSETEENLRNLSVTINLTNICSIGLAEEEKKGLEMLLKIIIK